MILGGTKFVGRAAAIEAIARGHDVTTFNRGTSSTPRGAKAIVGDRLAPDAYKALEGLSFDSVLDTWSQGPEAVRTAVEVLVGRVSHYVYISTISVYDDSRAQPPLSEESPVIDPEKSDFTYGKEKRGGELAAEKAGVPVMIARPGLILGPHEDIDARLPWWLGRLHRGGRTLGPGPRDNGLQYIDVRDLAFFVIDAAEKQLGGVYNVINEPAHTTIGELLDFANTTTGGHAELVWKDPETILSAGIAPWTELPCWLPPGPDHDFTSNCSVQKAFAAGLRARPMQETVADTWSWLQSEDEVPPTHGKLGLDPEKEAAVLR